MDRKPTWPEMALAGKLFAFLTDGGATFRNGLLGFTSVEINKGVIQLETTDGERFELSVRRMGD